LCVFNPFNFMIRFANHNIYYAMVGGLPQVLKIHKFSFFLCL